MEQAKPFFGIRLVPIQLVTLHITMTVTDTPGPEHSADQLITVAMKQNDRPSESDVVEFIDKHHPDLNGYAIQSMNVLTINSAERLELDRPDQDKIEPVEPDRPEDDPRKKRPVK